MKMDELIPLLTGRGLTEAKTVAELFKEPESPSTAADASRVLPRAFLLGDDAQPLRVRIFEQFDLHADGIIKDCEVGAIGLLQVVPAPDAAETGSARQSRFREWFRRCIDEAAYLRHLLVEDTREDGGGTRRQPYTVELVFIEREKNDPALSFAAGELRTLMYETTFLHAIGVNIWRCPLEDPASLRRALAWLLEETRSWLRQSGPGQAPLIRMKALSVEHFRLAGRRELPLDSGQTLHVVHGHNGSGKSSLVEALELAVTGKVERIEERRREQNATNTYRTILTNRHLASTAAATVTLTCEPPLAQETRHVSDDGIGAPLCPQMRAAAFRIDQRLADRLAAGTSADRARLFLEAFFPEKDAELEKWRRAHSRFETALAQLPVPVRVAIAPGDKPDVALAEQQLAWIAGDEIPWPKVREHIALKDEHLESIEPLLTKKLLGQIRATATLGWESAKSAAEEIDAALDRHRAKAGEQRQTLQHAAAILEALGPVAITPRAASDRDLADLMNDWLELIAITDLVEKEHAVLAAIEAALALGHHFSPDRTPCLAEWKKAPPAAKHAALLAELRKKLADARALIGSAQTPSTGPRTATATAAEAPSFQFEALNEAAHLGVFGEELKQSHPLLGHAVRTAFDRREVVEVQAEGRTVLRVGEPSWGVRLLTRVQRVIEGLNALSPSPEISGAAAPPATGLATLLPALRETQAAAVQLRQTDQTVTAAFMKLVGDGGPFSCAMNEVMALLTPARWAYEDIVAHADFVAAQQSLEFSTADKVPVRLRLNTAELNTFALGFFLLCARRVDANPLRLVVLDDPLQNMDEFTVTTVSRGICRLLRLWVELDCSTPATPWQVLLVLHGEGDMERVRQEAPCGAYFLPWLSPNQSGDAASEPLVAETSWIGSKVQSLEADVRDLRSK
jgi:recombinational DNA repair ATPase RecF